MGKRGPDHTEHREGVGSEDKKLIEQSHYIFMKGNPCLTNSIAFYDEMTVLVDDGIEVDVVYLSFSKAFDTISHDICISKLMKYGLDVWTVRCMENCLNYQALVEYTGVNNGPNTI